jgi:hypothetical protein
MNGQIKAYVYPDSKESVGLLERYREIGTYCKIFLNSALQIEISS